MISYISVGPQHGAIQTFEIDSGHQALRDGGYSRIAVTHIARTTEFDLLQRDIRGTNDPAHPIALLGLDLLTSTRLVLSVQSKRLLFRARELNDVWADVEDEII